MKDENKQKDAGIDPFKNNNIATIKTIIRHRNLLKGLLAAIPLAFILPAVCYLKLEEGSIFSAQKIGSLGLAVFGFGATAIGIVSLIIQVAIQHAETKLDFLMLVPDPSTLTCRHLSAKTTKLLLTDFLQSSGPVHTPIYLFSFCLHLVVGFELTTS